MSFTVGSGAAGSGLAAPGVSVTGGAGALLGALPAGGVVESGAAEAEAGAGGGGGGGGRLSFPPPHAMAALSEAPRTQPTKIRPENSERADRSEEGRAGKAERPEDWHAGDAERSEEGERAERAGEEEEEEDMARSFPPSRSPPQGPLDAGRRRPAGFDLHAAS